MNPEEIKYPWLKEIYERVMQKSSAEPITNETLEKKNIETEISPKIPESKLEKTEVKTQSISQNQNPDSFSLREPNLFKSALNLEVIVDRKNNSLRVLQHGRNILNSVRKTNIPYEKPRVHVFSSAYIEPATNDIIVKNIFVPSADSLKERIIHDPSFSDDEVLSYVEMIRISLN